MWRCTLLHVCVSDWTTISGLFVIGSCNFLNHIKAKALRHTVLFLHRFYVTFCKHLFQLLEGWMDSSSILYIISADWLIKHKTQTSSLVWPMRHLLVANATSVCKLVSTLFFCLSLPKSCFWFKCLISQRWWWWVGVVVLGDTKGLL